MERGFMEGSGQDEAQASPVAIHGGWITLGQLLKRLAYIQTGGEAKSWLREHDVRVNGEPETRRGRKLRPGDALQIGRERYVCVESDLGLGSDAETPPGV